MRVIFLIFDYYETTYEILNMYVYKYKYKYKFIYIKVI